ncbi:MAG TPA: HEAT repeat domain-containing protein [Phycisphaerae bacterium]|nr:HEAT repeat domain-containing protein [Phycisphaerae bacterium]HRR83399.1 HEAT repeat domain-containing protein [Phycisphaerae bacterium]
MRNWWMHGLCPVQMRLFVIVVICISGVIAPAPAQETTAEPAPAAAAEPDPRDATLESLFANYLHFALIGRFEVADQRFAQPLLSRPELNPMTPEAAETLIQLSEKYENSMDTLLLLINKSTIGENAQKIMNLIREAHTRKRMDPARIKANIDLLKGDPVQRAVAVERLVESGEYAVPWMLGLLSDPDREDLLPFIARALPQLGRNAINPLLAALDCKHERTLQVVIESLGKIGYPQALPYLQNLATAKDTPASIQKTAAEAVAQILSKNQGIQLKPAEELFRDLAEQHFAEIDSLRPDPREDRANLWRLRADARPGEDVVAPVAVDSRIYNLVRCMECCQTSLSLKTDQPAVLALWVAANFRREARLGLDVESQETVDARKLDPSRPENFPRSIYFARMAGPSCNQIVLARGIKQRDRNIALGAVTALNATAGRQAMTDVQAEGGTSMGEALYFPDLLVRVQAALALGKTLPPAPFHGSTEVVPVLASVLAPSEKKNYMLVDPEAESAGVIQTGLVNSGAVLVLADRLSPALNQARREMTHLDGIFLASDMKQPTVTEAIEQLAKDDRFCLTPIIVLVKENQTAVLDRIDGSDRRVGSIFVLTTPDKTTDPKIVEQLLAKLEQVTIRCGLRPLSPESRLSLALQAAGVIKGMAQSESTVFNAQAALPAMVETLRQAGAEELRAAVAAALAWMPAPQAQQAIAGIALAAEETESLRMTTFGLLADSARRFGNQLDDSLMSRLMEQATSEPNLTLRTAASQAMGAMNPPVEKILPIITGK